MNNVTTYGETDMKFPMWALHACLVHWMGAKGVARFNQARTKMDIDGAGYKLVGTRISAPGNGAAIIYWDTERTPTWVIEFFDGSGGTLKLDEATKSVEFYNYYERRTFNAQGTINTVWC